MSSNGYGDLTQDPRLVELVIEHQNGALSFSAFQHSFLTHIWNAYGGQVLGMMPDVLSDLVVTYIPDDHDFRISTQANQDQIIIDHYQESTGC